MSVTGIIFSNIHDEAVPEITSLRTIGSVPFGGRYRLIDFTLSNMVNAGIFSIGVITNHNYQSLLSHIGTGKDWDLARKNGGIRILPPYITSFDRPVDIRPNAHRLESLISLAPYFDNLKDDTIVFSDCDSVCNLDFKKMIEAHKATGADCTVVCRDTYVQGYEGSNLTVFEDDGFGNVAAMMPSGKLTKGFYNIAINVYIFSKKYLIDLLKEGKEKNYVSFREELIPGRIGKDKIRIYKYSGYYSSINSLIDYYNCNMDLLRADVRHALFKVPQRPILTNIKNSPPTFYSNDSKISNSLIADGCRIYGTVENSVIFRGVVVEKGAVVRNSVLMQKTIVHENAQLNYVIADKNVEIGKNVSVSSEKNNPIYYSKNMKIQ